MQHRLFIALALAAAILLSAQSQNAQHAQLEMLSVFPRESPPGYYTQVDPQELHNLAAQGWELAGVTPFVYRNEERGSANPKAVVTQTYPAYFFKRQKLIR